LIEHALNVTTREINQFLKLRFDLNEEKAILGSLINQDGTVSIQDENKLILSLIDIQQETIVKNGHWYRDVENRKTFKYPDLHLNLYLLVSAYFNPLNYLESLRFLSSVISFLHAKPVFNNSNTPGLLNTDIDKLTFEIYHQDSNSKNNLWSTLGAKYMPSILYKVKMLTVEDVNTRQILDGIEGMILDKELEL